MALRFLGITTALGWAAFVGVLPPPAIAQPSAADRAHWSFRPLRRPELPQVPTARVRTPIDRFVLAKLLDKSLDFAPDADRTMLVRRAHLDLIGLPPSPAEVGRFVDDERADAYERLLDRLLASPHFGERWGRHWLDAAGYADVGGTDNDAGIIRMAEGSWLYRDYVIRSFNEDKPFDQFLVEQLAGDELVDWRAAKSFTPETRERLIATGFLRTASDDTEENELNTPDIRHGVLHRTVEVVANNLLGLTLNCAKCHDHKYEPIGQDDYYRFAAIFSPAFNPQQWLQPKQRTLADVAPVQKAEIDKTNAGIQQQIDALKKKIEELKKAPPTDTKAQGELESKIKELNGQKRGFGPLRAVYDTGPPTPTRLLRRGDHARPGKEIPFGGMEVLCPPDQTRLPEAKPSGATSGRRLALARWLTEPGSPANSLLVRTQVNRVWQRLFGKGIVTTSDNLGVSGAKPTHPEMLEWLTAEFSERQGRLKPLLKQIMLSTVYRQSSVAEAAALKIDPANQWLGRMPLRRLEAEIIRDAMLAVSGKLDAKLGGPPVPLENRPDGLIVVQDSGKHRRSVYVLARRNYAPTLLNVFDQPFMTTNSVCRTPSAVVLQSLTMLNDAFVLEQAGGFAERILSQKATETPEQRVESAYGLALGRPPSLGERANCVAFLQRQADRHQAGKISVPEAQRRALVNLCHVILNTSEFLYVP